MVRYTKRQLLLLSTCHLRCAPAAVFVRTARHASTQHLDVVSSTPIKQGVDLIDKHMSALIGARQTSQKQKLYA